MEANVTNRWMSLSLANLYHINMRGINVTNEWKPMSSDHRQEWLTDIAHTRGEECQTNIAQFKNALEPLLLQHGPLSIHNEL